MNDRDLQRLYREGMQRPGERSSDAPDPALLLRVARGEATEAERLAVLDRVMQSDELRREYDLFRALAAAQRRRETLLPRLLAAAAVVVIFGGTLVWRETHRPDPYRGGGAPLSIIAPPADAEVAQPVTLVWHQVAGAHGYDIELLGEDGRVITKYSTADTVEVLLPEVGLAAGSAYSWSVTARLDNGIVVRSLVTRFRVRP
jgi:hypothetical protein